MTQHRGRKHHGTCSIGDGPPNGFVSDGRAQLCSGGLKQLIASNNLPVAKACNANPSNKDQNERDEFRAKTRVRAQGPRIWCHLANLHDKWVNELYNAGAGHATAHCWLATESAHVGLAHPNLFHEASLLIKQDGHLCP
jgi:hypothetical protein